MDVALLGRKAETTQACAVFAHAEICKESLPPLMPLFRFEELWAALLVMRTAWHRTYASLHSWITRTCCCKRKRRRPLLASRLETR